MRWLLFIAMFCFAFPAFAQGKGKAVVVEQIRDPGLVGVWRSDCLTPDPESRWSEQHTFVFTSDMRATHTRISWDLQGCAGSVNMSLVDSFRYVIEGDPERGGAGPIPVNLKGSMGTIQDIYEISGNTLRLGHGFRNKMSYAGAEGGGVTQRIRSLNNYIIYRKQK